MADFDQFESLLSLFEDRNSWQDAVAALASYNLVSLHISPGEPTLSLTFELLLPPPESGADGTNAVVFAVIFHGAGNLAITRWGALNCFAVQPGEAGGWQAVLYGPESEVRFTFGSMTVDGVRYFRAGSR